jgi:glutamyl-tRNA synthetase
MSIVENRQIAELVFPNWKTLKTLEELEQRYPKRDLPTTAKVTRIAPSPTGFMHIGTVFTALVNKLLAYQSGGVFFVRIEDTDQKRTIDGAFATIVDSLPEFGLEVDEGSLRDTVSGEIIERGNYDPYTQTSRLEIYSAVAFQLLCQGKIYPCFLTSDELALIREKQQKAGIRPGIYGTFAEGRKLSTSQIISRLESGSEFVLRLKASGNPYNTISWNDSIRGALSLPENDLDVVLVKSNGVPLYHFAVVVDDHFMRVTHVIRGDEWIASCPIHLDIYSQLNWETPIFGHIAPIQKSEGGSRRKLSKRKDPEANIAYYREKGFPFPAVIDYLLNLANSNFEEWRNNNTLESILGFPFNLDKMGVAGALADLVKLESVSKNYLSAISIEDFYSQAILWAESFDKNLSIEMKKDPAFTKRALNVERQGEKSAKRFTTFASIQTELSPFYDSYLPYYKDLEFPPHISDELRNTILTRFEEILPKEVRADEIFPLIKLLARELNFAENSKQLKLNPERYHGHVGDIAMILRVALFGKKTSPDLGEISEVLGHFKIQYRLHRARGL